MLHLAVKGINTSESSALCNMFEMPSIMYANERCEMTSPTPSMHLCFPYGPCDLKELFGYLLRESFHKFYTE